MEGLGREIGQEGRGREGREELDPVQPPPFQNLKTDTVAKQN